MASTADVVQFMKTQEKILTAIENLRKDFEYKDPCCSNGFKISQSSHRYMITGRIDPFLKHQIKVNFSEDEKYLIMTGSHEHSCGHCITLHKMVRKFRIEDKCNLKSMQHQITDNFITITIEEEDSSFKEREEAPEVQVTRKRKGKYVKTTDRDLDMIATPEGELLPRYVVERTTIDPEVYQRKIEIPPDLNFPEINEAYVVFRDDEFEPCPEFKRQIDEMSEKRTKEIEAAWKKSREERQKELEEMRRTRLATSQSTSVPEDTDTSISREKPVGEDTMESEKKAAEKSEELTERKSVVQSQEAADDSEEAAEILKDFKVVSTLSDEDHGDEKRFEEETKREDGDETQKKSIDEKTEEVDVGKSLEETKEKTDDEKQPETAMKEEEKEESVIVPEVSKQQPDEGEETEDKDSKVTVPETPPKDSKQQRDEGDKADPREATPGPSKLPSIEEKQPGDREEAKGKKKRKKK